MTKQEFEEMWKELKEHDAKVEAQWNAMSEEEKNKLRAQYIDPSYSRIYDDEVIDGNL